MSDFHEGAMIALLPSAEDAQRLAVEGYEAPQDMHVTLAYLGKAKDLEDWTSLEAGCRRLAAECPPLNLQTWATSHFNPTGEEPCAVYLVGKGEREHGDALEQIKAGAVDLATNEVTELPTQHSPWIPHMTVGYDLDPNALTHGGADLVFDKLRLAVGGDIIDIPLEGDKKPVAAAGLLAASIARTLDNLEALVAADGGIVRKALAAWNELLHPRGRDGRFIVKDGWVDGKVTVDKGQGGGSVEARRARVVKFIPNPSNADDPIVEVDLGDGKTGRALASTVKSTAGPKARLSGPRPDSLPSDGVDIEDPTILTPDQIEAIFSNADGEPVIVTTVDDALMELAAGNKVDLQMPEHVSILLDRMVEMVEDATARGDQAPNYNLCEVTIKGASLFCSDNKDIPRIDMPQLSGIPLPGTPAADKDPDDAGWVNLNADFRAMLEERGVGVTDATVKASTLKASQNELNGPKVAAIAQEMAGGGDPLSGTRLFISKDGYVVDGHHRWAANVATTFDGSNDPEMDVAVVDMGILELLAEANRFAKEQGIPQVSAAEPDGPRIDLRTAEEYGLYYSRAASELPELQVARDWDGWESAPIEEFDPADLILTEDSFDPATIDRVTSGQVPMREGYVARVMRDENDNVFVVDGNHRAIMASEMQQPLQARVVNTVDLPAEPALAEPDVPEDATLDVGENKGFDMVPGDQGPMSRDQIDLLDTAQTMAYVNAMAGQLSQDDADARAAGLDEIFSGVFRSKLDTEATHNHLGGDGEQWTEERMALHEEMYNSLYEKVQAAGIPQDKDAFVLGGLPGAGKSSSLQPGGPAEQFGVVAWDPGDGDDIPEGVTHVSINPDSIKEMLIDQGALPTGVSGLKPLEQVSFIHEESSMLSKLFLDRLSSEGFNVVLDNTMETPQGMKKRMIPLAGKDYTFRGLFVDITPEESLASAKGRYARLFDSERGGRFVPGSVQADRTSIRGRMSSNRDAFDELAGIDDSDNITGAGWFQDFLVIDNTGVSTQTPLREVTITGQGDGSPAAEYRPQASQAELLERTT